MLERLKCSVNKTIARDQGFRNVHLQHSRRGEWHLESSTLLSTGLRQNKLNQMQEGCMHEIPACKHAIAEQSKADPTIATDKKQRVIPLNEHRFTQEHQKTNENSQPNDDARATHKSEFSACTDQPIGQKSSTFAVLREDKGFRLTYWQHEVQSNSNDLRSQYPQW
jgi:hypothetical protein